MVLIGLAGYGDPWFFEVAEYELGTLLRTAGENEPVSPFR